MTQPFSYQQQISNMPVSNTAKCCSQLINKCLTSTKIVSLTFQRCSLLSSVQYQISQLSVSTYSSVQYQMLQRVDFQGSNITVRLNILQPVNHRVSYFKYDSKPNIQMLRLHYCGVEISNMTVSSKSHTAAS